MSTNRRDQMLSTFNNFQGQMTSSLRSGQHQTSQSSAQQNQPDIGAALERGYGALQRGLTDLQLGSGFANAESQFQSPRSVSRAPGSSDPATQAFNNNSSSASSSSSLPPRSADGLIQQEYSYLSQSGRLAATVFGSGTLHHPTFISDRFERFAGNVTVRLDRPESISAIRVRLKCCLTTAVFTEPTHPTRPSKQMNEEVILVDETQTLWSASSSDSKVEGTRHFKFNMRFPHAISVKGRQYSLPPSFQAGAGSDVGTIKYYAKVVLARQGFLSANERLIFPLVFLPQHQPIPALTTRSRIYQSTRSLPSPSEDPSAWTGQQAQQVVDGTSSGIGSGGKGWLSKLSAGGGGGGAKKSARVDYIALVPDPAIFDRHAPLMAYVKVSSSDLNVTGAIKAGCAKIKIIQSNSVTAQGCSKTLEHVLGTYPVHSEARDEASSEDTATGRVWSNKFRATVDLPNVPVSFHAPNFSCSYALLFEFTLPKATPFRLRIPIEIASTPAPSLQRSQTMPPPQRTAPAASPPLPQRRTSTHKPTKGKAGSMFGEGNEHVPTKYDPPASPPPQHAGPSAGPSSAGPSSSPNQASPSQPTQPLQDSQGSTAEILDADAPPQMPDVPPSYWESVEQGTQTDRPVRRSRFGIV